MKGKTTKATQAASRARRQPAAPGRVLDAPGIGEQDLHYFNEGTNSRAHRVLGSHLAAVGEEAGTSFAVWAPNAEMVAVVGDFNDWDKRRHALRPVG